MDMIIQKNDSPSAQMQNLKKASSLSLKVSQTETFLSKFRLQTSIKSITLEDAKLWMKILESYPKDVIREFFAHMSDKCVFLKYVIEILALNIKCHLINILQHTKC